VKKIFRKNQLVITALALMIAVAGYFGYMNNNIDEETLYISDEAVTDEIFTDEGTYDDIAFAEEDEEAEVTGAETFEEENAGETIYTSASVASLDYAAEIKLNREQIRSKNKESMLEIVNNSEISDDLKQEAINKMIAMTDIAEREAAAEMLLEAKGFTDVVVSINDDNCDVVLNMGEVTDAKRAQVEDIVKRKTNISADKIVITPISVEQ
jgi:stage III sporulation protein AH